MQYPSIAAGQRITGSLLRSMLPQTYVKTAATPRSSTTTYEDDPELAGIPLAVGSYVIELIGFFTLTTTNTQKLKTRWAFTGSWNSPLRACVGPGFAQTAGPAAVTESTFSAYQTDGSDAIYDQAAGGTFGVFRETCLNVVVSAAGNLSLQWAQAASSGNNTTLQFGSGFTIRRVA